VDLLVGAPRSEKTGKEIRSRVKNGERGGKIIAAIHKG
jgi:hypothetical protein